MARDPEVRGRASHRPRCLRVHGPPVSQPGHAVASRVTLVFLLRLHGCKDAGTGSPRLCYWTGVVIWQALWRRAVLRSLLADAVVSTVHGAGWKIHALLHHGSAGGFDYGCDRNLRRGPGPFAPLAKGAISGEELDEAYSRLCVAAGALLFRPGLSGCNATLSPLYKRDRRRPRESGRLFPA